MSSDLSHSFGIQIVSEQVLNPVGTTQLRCLQPAKYLSDLGIRVATGHLYRSIPEKRSIIIIHRAVFDRYTKIFISYAKLRGSVVVYDTDDLLFDPAAEKYLSDIRNTNYLRRANLYKKAMVRCDIVLVATKFLGEKAKIFHPDVRLIKNALNVEFIEAASILVANEDQRQDNNVTIAYLSGSSSHDRDFQLVESDLLKLLRERPQVKILLAGSLQYSSEFEVFGDRFEYRKFMPYAELQKLFTQIDINLVPLETEQDFCQAKSELKYIEAGAFGVPSVVSPTLIHQQLISHDVNGRLVEDNDWYGAIDGLIVNEELRKMLGAEARKQVLQHYSAERRMEDWQDLVTDIWQEYSETRNIAPIKLKPIFLRTYLEIIRWFRGAPILFRNLLSN